jgi:hypothetical protein
MTDPKTISFPLFSYYLKPTTYGMLPGYYLESVPGSGPPFERVYGFLTKEEAVEWVAIQQEWLQTLIRKRLLEKPVYIEAQYRARAR